MTKRKNAKLVVLTSAICLLLCCTLALGNTYAWFTDSVTNEGNIIAAGNLDVEMTYSEDGSNWENANSGKIFEYSKWEPGYTEVRYVKIANAGNLAFKYSLKLESDEVANEYGKKLSEVIDVYFAASVANRGDVSNMFYAGTLDKLMADNDGAAYGQMLPGESLDYCIVLKMQESAGNEYQNLEVGSGIAVKLFAEQLTYEEDSFGPDYDANAGQPVAAVYRNPKNENVPIDWLGYGIWQADGEYANHPLEAAYVFAATDEDVSENPYKDWLCDFYVSLDRDLKSNQLFLGGAYGGFLVGFNVDEDILGIGYPETNTLPANTVIPLLGSVTGGMSNWTYEAIANDVQEFGCGVADIDNALVGATFTVELRMINPDDHEEYKVISKVEYVFTDEVYTAEELLARMEDSEAVSLGTDIALPVDTTITIPAGKEFTLKLNGHTLSGENTRTATNNDMILVKGTLNVSNGTLTMNHTGTNMGWGGCTNLFDVTAGGVLNIENAKVINKGGTDMNFAVHMNNWGTVTLNANNCTFEGTYCGVRVFNSGYDMNTVTIKNSTLKGGSSAFWVHNYTAADFGASYDADAVAARLNIDIVNGTNTFICDKAPIRYGFTNAVRYNADGILAE